MVRARSGSAATRAVAAIFRDKRDRFVKVGRSAGHVDYEAAPWYAASLCSLPDRECEALTVLDSYQASRIERATTRIVASRLRRKGFKRALQKLPAAERHEVKRTIDRFV